MAITGEVTLTDRFGSALNLNIHLHKLFVDSMYVTTGGGPRFRRVPPPTREVLEKLVRRISGRGGRTLERLSLLARDREKSFLTPNSPDGAGFDEPLRHSITYHVALHPSSGLQGVHLADRTGCDTRHRREVSEFGVRVKTRPSAAPFRLRRENIPFRFCSAPNTACHPPRFRGVASGTLRSAVGSQFWQCGNLRFDVIRPVKFGINQGSAQS